MQRVTLVGASVRREMNGVEGLRSHLTKMRRVRLIARIDGAVGIAESGGDSANFFL